MEYAITTEGLTKVYRVRQTTDRKTETREIKAVLDLNLRICRGELFGLLGVNGAGKTTTIRMLATLLEPTSGTAVVNGIGQDASADGPGTCRDGKDRAPHHP